MIEPTDTQSPAAGESAPPGTGTSRTPGAMAGEIEIAPDFDELPDDMAEPPAG